MNKAIIKRISDILLAFIFLIVALIPIFIIIILLYFKNGASEVFFMQYRPGRNEKLFRLIKFKTMNNKCDASGNLLPDAERLTAIGRFIRKTSLDELPQLWNVLKGDMSLVGPRPLLVEYMPLYNDMQKRRHEVRPGITGWAQVNGRNAISWEQKFEYDVWYVDNCSFLLDVKILWLTVLKVFRREGVNYSDNITMIKFKGTGR